MPKRPGLIVVANRLPVNRVHAATPTGGRRPPSATA